MCGTCRTRKRGCDKRLPRCGFCFSRGYAYACDYTEALVPDASSTAGLPYNGPRKLIGSLSLDSTVKAQVDSIFKAMDLTPQMVEQRYFRDFHPSLPIIAPQTSPCRIHHGLERAPADAAILVLAMLLVSHQLPTADSLYSALRKLVVSVQDSRGASIAVVQAQLLIGGFEHAHGWVEKSYVSVGVCASLARILRINVNRTGGFSADSTHKGLADQEAWNLWWGIIVLESVVLSELPHVLARSIAEDLEEGVSLPSDLVELPGTPTWSPSRDAMFHSPAENVSRFGRQVQAVLLLSRAVRLSRRPLEPDGSLSRLKALDKQTKVFIGLLLKEGIQASNSREGALPIAVRSLFVLHEDFVENSRPLLSADDIDWSWATLDTVVTMLIDAAYDHMRESACPHALLLCCAANLRSSSKHMSRYNVGGSKDLDAGVLRDLEVVVSAVRRCGTHV